MTIQENVTWKPLGEKVVAVKVKTGEYYTMNELASLIWKMLADGKSESDVEAKIRDEYEVGEDVDVAADIKSQLEEWKNEGLIN